MVAQKMMKALSLLGASALLMAGAIGPASADFHAYEHANFQNQITQVRGGHWYIDVPDDVVSSVKNYTDTCYTGRDNLWYGSVLVIELSPGQDMRNLYGGNDRINYFAQCWLGAL
ncbi:MAG: hypothetical protein Q4P78_00895 [Rothia sp. (in: high G+C Gram-positive bacteria)]|uniref:hypothetical protein n=1 Tax=Rothia sp. (in: high G+C Gram-positive bacteria) TaxID=1885016 RepID=UPI0026DF83BA|nr:hypothetical protein [Rothia sp. (in: high G+C Gram-positive bacteria)]MDO5749747.1 hypothetical protein [Rothia sp. (in: high G+C Gram-positive bacteria)]